MQIGGLQVQNLQGRPRLETQGRADATLESEEQYGGRILSPLVTPVLSPKAFN